MSRFPIHIARRAIARPVLFAVVVLAGLSAAADAMRVSPMVVEMTTTGSGATARIEVQNINSAPLPFETQITQLSYDNDGNITETPADKDFLVFPPQGVLPVGARQVIRLQWLGGADLPASRAYYLSINQIPVQLGPAAANAAGAQVQIVYHIKALVTVAPPKASPKLEVLDAKAAMIPPKANPGSAEAPTGPGTPGVAVTIRNTGTRYAMMSGATWTLDGTDKAGKPLHVVIGPEDLNHDIGAGYVAPLTGQRVFKVSTPTPFGNGPIKVRFSK